MANPKPVALTQVAAGDYTGRGAPKPLLVVGDIPGAGGGATAWADVTGKPTTFAPIVGTAANQALAGNTVIPAVATWANISGKPAVVAAGTTEAAARAAIGAGTGNGSSNLTLAQSQAGIATKTQIAALSNASAAVGEDAAALLVELNATITKLNAVIAALKA